MKGYDWLMAQNYIEWFKGWNRYGSVHKNFIDASSSSFRHYGPFGSLRADTPAEEWKPRRDAYLSMNLERY